MLICKQELLVKEVNAGLPNCVPSFKSGPVVDKGVKSSTDRINTMHLLYLLPQLPLLLCLGVLILEMDRLPGMYLRELLGNAYINVASD